MKFVLISDVHVDINAWQPQILDEFQHIGTIVVAGDISNDVYTTCRWLTQLRSAWNRVIWVAGNHDHYNSSFHQTRLRGDKPPPRTVKEIYEHYAQHAQQEGIDFLHRSSVVVEGVEFCGVTGWHDFVAGVPYSQAQQIAAWQKFMTDSHATTWGSDDSVSELMQHAGDDASWLRQHVCSNDLPKVIVSHHIPHQDLCMYRPHDMMWTLLNGSFCNSELQTVQHTSIQAWCFGHTHFAYDRMIEGVRYLCNPRGYPRENGNWQPIVVEV
jgi:predicted phosphodiesterase